MRTFSKCAHLVGLAFALSACSSAEEAAEKKTVTRVEIPESEFKPVELENTIDDLISAIGQTEPQDLQLGVFLKNLSGYWEPVKVGANRAFGELEVSGVVLAPSESDETESANRQLELLQERRDAGYDAFGIAPLSNNVEEEINTIVDSGIPVVTIDSDLVDSARQVYMGTINYDAGATAGGTLTGMLAGGGGTVIILGHEDVAGWPDGANRTQGARDVIEAAGYTVIVRQTNWTAEGAATDVEFMAETLETADPPAVGMLSMFSPTFRCAQAAEAAGLTGDDITIVGFDFEPDTLAYMRSGMIKATHAQRQYYMGYLAPYLLYSMKVLGEDKTREVIAPHMVDSARFNTGLDVVAHDKVEDYNAFLDSLGIGG